MTTTVDLLRFNLHPGSHRKVDVECDLKISTRCKGRYRLALRNAMAWANKNDGRVICLACSRQLKFSGRNNPNCKYDVPDGFFKIIDTDVKAYFLGWIASDGHLSKNQTSVVISIQKGDRSILEDLRAQICSELPIEKKGDMVALRFCSREIHQDICGHLGLTTGGKKSHLVEFPKLEDPTLKWAFLRGYFDGDGGISSLQTELKNHRFPAPSIKIESNSPKMLSSIQELAGGNLYKTSIEWNGTAALDFLAKIYDNRHLRLTRKWNTYMDWAAWKAGTCGGGTKCDYTTGFSWCKTRPDAVAPQKTRASDSGFDLHILEKVKQMGLVELFDTGIKVRPPYGHYFDLVPRSSIIKTGYMLANSIGIIDQTYIGNILVPLIRCGDAPPLQLPAKIVQLIPRPIMHCEIVQVDRFDENTDRGEGGFGSTDRLKRSTST